MFLGFRNSLRKELTQWLRGPGVLIIAGISILGAIFMTLIPFIAEATGEAEAAGPDLDGPDHQRPAAVDRSDRRADRRHRDDGAHLERT